MRSTSGRFQNLRAPTGIGSIPDKICSGCMHCGRTAKNGALDQCKIKSVASRSEPEAARLIRDEAKLQAEDGSGWLLGPYTKEQLDQQFPEGWVASRRFGVAQSAKTRAIDDLKASFINASCGHEDHLVMQDLDMVAETIRTFMKNLGEKHPSLAQGLSGRAIDLKSAYKQLASSPQDSWASVLGVWDPDAHDVVYYRFATLPFGSSRSVTAFHRVASALRKILIRLVRLIVTNFYDDFCQIEKDSLTTSATETANLVFRMLGWRVAEDPRKALPVAKVFTLLGP